MKDYAMTLVTQEMVAQKDGLSKQKPKPKAEKAPELRRRVHLDSELSRMCVNIQRSDGAISAHYPADDEIIIIQKNPGIKKGFKMSVSGRPIYGCPDNEDPEAWIIMELLGLDDLVSDKIAHPKGAKGWIYAGVYFDTNECVASGSYMARSLRSALLAQRNKHVSVFNDRNNRWEFQNWIEDGEGPDPRLFEEVAQQ